jgi:hypothetical protein
MGRAGINVSLHSEIVEQHAMVLDNLLSHEAKSHALKKRPSGNTDVRMQLPNTLACRPRSSTTDQPTSYPLALNLGMHVEQINTSGIIDPDKSGNSRRTLGDESRAGFEAPPPRL